MERNEMGLETRRIEITAFNGERTRESVFRRSVQCGRPHEQFIPCAIYMTGGARFYLPATCNACIFLRFYFFFFSFFIEEKKNAPPPVRVVVNTTRDHRAFRAIIHSPRSGDQL